MLVIYKPDDIYCLSEMLTYWNNMARMNGFDGIYVIGENCVNCDSVDAVMLHQPVSSFMSFNSDYVTADGLHIYNYESVWKKILETPKSNKKVTYYMGFAKYDDTPRRGMKGLVVENASADLFKKYYGRLKKKSEREHLEFIFLNAWNEWGEGMYIEPDEEDGYDYLEAHHQVFNMTWDEKVNDEEIQTTAWPLKKKNKIVAYYDLLNQWMSLKENNKNIADYLITNNIKTIAIYGYGDLGKHLYHALRDSMVHVEYIIDKNLCMPNLVKRPEEKLGTVDAVIVTPFLEFEDIIKVLQIKLNCKLISIEELILESL